MTADGERRVRAVSSPPPSADPALLVHTPTHSGHTAFSLVEGVGILPYSFYTSFLRTYLTRDLLITCYLKYTGNLKLEENMLGEIENTLQTIWDVLLFVLELSATVPHGGTIFAKPSLVSGQWDP